MESVFEAPDKNIFCCRLTPDFDIEQIHEDIRNKQRSPSCASCWRLEDSGLVSERQIHNRTMDFLLDLNMENIESASLEHGFDPRAIKLTTSNLCNAQCITCGSTLSSAWAALENKSTQYRGMDFDLLDPRIKWDKIVSLSMMGGEPLLEKKNFELLERLIELGNTDCFISLVTNGSIELSASKIKILEKFKKLNICLSIDGVGPVFEYMRFPLKWTVLLENIKLFRNLTNNLSVSCMISNVNVYYYSDTVNFFKENNLNYICKQINDPAIFSPGNLPASFKDLVVENNQQYHSDIKAFLDIGVYTESKFEQFKNEMQRQDSLKRIKFADYLPALVNLL